LCYSLPSDADLSTLTALEEYLTEVFQGCLVVVSHDNFFVNRVAEHLFVFQGNGVVSDFQGSYDDYLEYRRESKQAAGKGKTAGVIEESPLDVAVPVASKSVADSSELTKEEKKELSRLEKEIEALAAERGQAEEKLYAASAAVPLDSALVGRLGASLAELTAQIAEKEEQWMQLNVL
jgi:ATP-binding cassette subfamily F protein uup